MLRKLCVRKSYALYSSSHEWFENLQFDAAFNTWYNTRFPACYHFHDGNILTFRRLVAPSFLSLVRFHVNHIWPHLCNISLCKRPRSDRGRADNGGIFITMKSNGYTQQQRLHVDRATVRRAIHLPATTCGDTRRRRCIARRLAVINWIKRCTMLGSKTSPKWNRCQEMELLGK